MVLYIPKRHRLLLPHSQNQLSLQKDLPHLPSSNNILHSNDCHSYTTTLLIRLHIPSPFLQVEEDETIPFTKVSNFLAQSLHLIVINYDKYTTFLIYGNTMCKTGISISSCKDAEVV